MKNIKLWILICVPLVFSCSKEEFSLNEEVFDAENKALQTECNVKGNSCGNPGGTLVLTYDSDFGVNDVNWSIQSGNISIISGQGTNRVTLRLGSNFSGGSVFVIGSGNGGIVCSDSYSLTRCVSTGCTPPIAIDLRQTSGSCPGDVFTFNANPNGSVDSGSYNWEGFHGSQVISGQGTSTVRVQSSSSSTFSFLIKVTHVNSCENTSISTSTLAQFDWDCDDNGGPGLGF
ncbi:hypothetical protein SAMN04487910_0122 [Aquimarina amphilecti]|uniref:PKD-like domain-containing protein n=1 Tax=Aquimarina amphilecti TaxID=1038014 RepID=A0A1H7FNI3_AQUAM|nr:hypothetical protein [Aquimarina amphilecti]SEK26767.1 hypothetical protein SAMN04487910_0122 [Aquimarina amphilecti]